MNWRGPHGGIREKLTVSFSLLVVALAAFVVIFFPNRLERQASRAQFARAESVRDMMAYSVSAALYFGDTSGVLEVLEGGARDPDVQMLEVRDAAGRVVAQRVSPGTTIPTDSVGPGGSLVGGTTYITPPAIVVHNATPVGTLRVGMSMASVRAEVVGARRLGLFVGLVVLALGLALVGAISTLVTRPLKQMVDSVRQIAAGDLTHRAPESTDADIAQLVTAFNRMVDTLAAARDELSLLNAQLEDRVRARTAELQSLIDLAPQAIVAVDLDWKVTRWNRAAERLFGWTAQEVLGEALPLVPEDQREEFQAQQLALQGGRTAFSHEAVRVRKDGTRLNVLVSSGALFDGQGAPVGSLAILTDLTDRKSLEEQLRQSQKMEAVGRLAGGVAHDFNNILTVITSSASLLADDALTPDQRETVEQINLAAMRAAALTRQLLTFSRQHVLQLQPVNLNEVVHGISPMLRRLLPENIRVTTMLSLEGGVVTADARQIEQVIMNLVVNAADAMPQGGKLTIETQSVTLDEAFTQRHPDVVPGEYVLLAVRDTGIGISPEVMPRIFEPFFTTKDVGKGTGLGLATVYAVTKQLKGCIDVESTQDMGTAFLIYIPRTVQPVSNDGAGATAKSAAKGQEVVLIVEDEDSVRRMLRRTLERLGYRVIEAANGEEGLHHANLHGSEIDIVVTDLMMPGMNGRDFAERLQVTHPRLRVVFMSGYTDEATRDRGLVDDDHAFIPKPFSGAELGQMIRTLLDRPRRPERVGS